MLTQANEAPKARRLITTDSHWAPPMRLVDELPARYRSELPHLEERSDGLYYVTPRRGITNELGVGERKLEPADLDRAAAGGCPASNPSPYPKGRLAEMARDGVLAEVLIGPGGFGLFVEPDVERAWCTLINDWLAENYRDHMHQFAPGIHLPFACGMEEAIKELERAAKLGLRPILLPDYFTDKPYYLPEWEPLWEAANALKIPVTLHISPNRGYESPRRAQWRGAGETGFTMMSVCQSETVCWFVFSGILERYPDLKIVLTEGSAGWLSWLVPFADYAHLGRFKEVAQMLHGGAPRLKEKPSEYIKRQVACTFMWDPLAVQARNITGLDCLMWGNDYPHFEGVFPDSQAFVDEQFAGVPEAEIDQMVSGNAAKVFGFAV